MLRASAWVQSCRAELLANWITDQPGYSDFRSEKVVGDEVVTDGQKNGNEKPSRHFIDTSLLLLTLNLGFICS